MANPLNVATPPTAARVAVPLRVPLDGFAAMARVTLAVDVVRLPLASSMRTVTAGLIAAPAEAVVGCTAKASRAAAPAVMVMVPDVACVRPVPVKLSVRSPIVPVMARPLKVATPFASVVAVRVPPNVPSPDAMATVTTTPASATVPEASRSWILGCVAKATPLAADADGAVVIANRSGTRTVTTLLSASPGLGVALSFTRRRNSVVPDSAGGE